MRDVRPGAWPLRPARCSRRATPLALPICSTRSTGKKSTPKSRLLVATTAFRRPSFRPSSTQSRTDLSSEPWCSASTPAKSGRASISAWYQRSACERVLVKISVEPAPSITSATCGSICKPMCPAQAKRSARAGSRVSMTRSLGSRPRINAGSGV